MFLTSRWKSLTPCHLGFTLIELMVTVVVAAILAAVGIPNLRDMIQNNRVTTQVNELVTALSLGRSEAVKRGRNAQVAVTQSGQGWLATVSVGGETLRVIDYSASSIGVDAASTVTFTATGIPNTGTTFTMQPGKCPAGKKWQGMITVAPTGQITTRREYCDEDD